VYPRCHLSGLSMLLPCVSSMQAISTVLSSFANLNLSLETHDWQRLTHALLQVFKGGEVRVEAVTSVVWSGAVWGRLEDPSTLDVVKAVRTRAEQSPRLAASLGTQGVHQALAQVCQYQSDQGYGSGRLVDVHPSLCSWLCRPCTASSPDPRHAHTASCRHCSPPCPTSLADSLTTSGLPICRGEGRRCDGWFSRVCSEGSA
jgi:hypothetical protein